METIPLPLVETPPVETPPVETPPVETPPVETPSLEIPPVETLSLETHSLEIPSLEGLVYDDTIDTSTIQNVLFINSTVTNFQQYANANTFPIVYNSMSTREKMLELLTNKFQHISRRALVCHFEESPYFLNNEILFSDTNTQFIIDLVKQFNVLHMDYLACSTLQSQSWTSYYAKIQDATGIPVGASDDDTGNLKYGGDWILESTQENIQTIYFNDLIQNYADVLTLTTIVISNVLALNNKASIRYAALSGTPPF